MRAALGAVGGCLLLAACAPAPPQVPAEYRDEVRRAGRECAGVSAKVIAAQLQQESGWDPKAISDKGAQGIAQFMPETWERWGVDLDGDGEADPFDPVEAIDAQGRLMCYLIGEAKASGLGGQPIILALAAYNAGWGPVAANRGVPPYAETKAYVERIMDLEERIVVRDEASS